MTRAIDLRIEAREQLDEAFRLSARADQFVSLDLHTQGLVLRANFARVTLDLGRAGGVCARGWLRGDRSHVYDGTPHDVECESHDWLTALAGIFGARASQLVDSAESLRQRANDLVDELNESHAA